VQRRRGAALETALLEAAWDEMRAVGYPGFTLDGVAARAGTSRSVISRRWPSRAELLVAAIRHHTSFAALEPPDTGTLRGDVLALLRQMSEGVGEIAGVLSFLVADHFNATGLPPSDLRARAIAGDTDVMATILQRAVERGEIKADHVSPRIASLPVDLVRHDLIMTQAPVPDDTLAEIVDRIFLPLLRPAKPRPGSSTLEDSLCRGGPLTNGRQCAEA
jgi:AcrR family transcriptional regulator